MAPEFLPTNFRSGLPSPDSSASFWHSQPSPTLLDYQSTEKVPPEADFVVVGTGITGANAARFLAEDPRTKGKKICVLEAREVCWGATGRNGGHCQPLLFDRDPQIGAFEKRNIEDVESYIEKHKVDCSWRKVTSCHAFWTEESLVESEENVKKLEKTHPDLAKTVRVSREEADLKASRVSPTAKGVILCEGAGTLWPYKLIAFMVEKLLQDKKISLYTNTPVTKVTCPTDAERAKGGSNRCVVTTSRGTISARHVVLATNGYTSHLLPELGQIIAPRRCEMSALLPPMGSTRLPNSYGLVAFHGASVDADDYLMQLPYYSAGSKASADSSAAGDSGEFGGQLMLGGGREHATYPCLGEWEDNIVDEGEAGYLRRVLLSSLVLDGETKGLEELRASHQWTGIKGLSRDHSPWVGSVPGRPGVWLAAAYSGHGMPNATLCAKAVVDMLLAHDHPRDGQPKLDLPDAYLFTADRLDRAHKLEPIGSSNGIRSATLGGGKATDSGRACDVM